MTSTAEKALCLLRTCGPLTNGDLARRLNIGRAWCYALVYDLRLKGLAARDEMYGYEITEAGRAWFSGGRRSQPLLSGVARPGSPNEWGEK